MQSIQIDTDVFTFLQKNAIPLVDTPNTILRRLLGIEEQVKAAQLTSTKDEFDLDQLLRESVKNRRTRAPNANLKTLVSAGFLREGERLFLVDYQDQKIAGCEATVSGPLLSSKGQSSSMSKLAQEQLKKVGFESESVRGPSHWVNAKGVSVGKLWQQFTEQQAKK